MSVAGEVLVGKVTVEGVTWEVCRVSGMFRIWTGPGEPRYVISADIPCEVFDMMAQDVSSRTSTKDEPDQLGPDVDLLDVEGPVLPREAEQRLERSAREAAEECEYP